MKEKLINEYVNRMTIADVNNFAIKNGIILKEDEVNLIYNHIKRTASLARQIAAGIAGPHRHAIT